MMAAEPGIAMILLLVVYVMTAAEPGIALKLEPAGTSTHIPPLLDCAPPRPAARSSNDGLRAFRDNLLALLDALPPAVAAAAPTGGFATAQSGDAVGGDRAFARAFCYGFGASPSSSDCLNCLTAAAQDVADGCHGRRGAVWRAGCFLSYADTNGSTAREDAWSGWFYFYNDDDTPTTAVGACMADRIAAECSRCLNESAQVVPALKERRQLSLAHGDAVVVVGYSCYLRVPLFRPVFRWPEWVNYAVGVFDVVGILLIEIGGIMCCISIARRLNPAA